jgi:hypothetical protein
LSARGAGVVLAVLAACAAGCSWLAGVGGDVEIVDAMDAAQETSLPNDVAPPPDTSPPPDAGSDTSAPDVDADAPPEASDIPEGGVPPNGNELVCGAKTCTPRLQACCYASSQQDCVSAVTPNCGSGVVSRCDERLDCDAGLVCCVLQIKPYGIDAACKPSCAPGEPQACRTNSECGTAGPCVPWQCVRGTVETCAGAGADGGCTP